MDSRKLFLLIGALFVAGLTVIHACEVAGNPALGAGANMEGKEQRFGAMLSALWAASTTAASNGSVNAMHDSFMPLSGLVMMLNMQVGEVIFGGVGSGLYGMLLYVVLAVFLAGFALIWRTVHSPFGQVLKAIRENEPRAVSLGYRTERYKLLAFVLSASLAGLAGGTKALVFQLASLTDVTWQMSGEVVLMTLLGGMGTLLGPVVGAGFVVALGNYLAATSLPVPVVIGAIFVVCVLLFRRGIVGEIAHRLRRRTT